MININEFRSQAQGLADLLNYAALISDDVLLNKDGSLMAAWEYRGVDAESCSTDDLAAVSAHVNAAIASLGSGWMLHVDAIRESSLIAVSTSIFPDRTTRLIDDERARQFEQGGTHHQTRYVYSISYMPMPESIENIQGHIFGQHRDCDGSFTASKALYTFRDALRSLEQRLSAALNLRRLSTVELGGLHSHELLTHLHSCITGDTHPTSMPSTPMYLDCLLGSQDFYGDLKPRIGRKHIRPISIVGYPQASSPAMLHMLHNLPASYRWSSRFIFLDQTVAERYIASFEKKWFGRRKSLRTLVVEQSGGGPGAVNAHADAMAADAQTALAEASSGTVKFGFFTSVVIVMDEDPEVANSVAQSIIKVINNTGFAARLEDVNAVEAYLGSLPGHSHPNVRRPLMHSLNVADLIPLTSIWPGESRHQSPYYSTNSPPLALTSTTGSTPFRLNLHVGDVGHTLVIGPTGSGKSTLLGFLMAQQFRYTRAQVFAFDKGYSSLVLCQACGGEYYTFASGSDSPAFCPLACIEAPAERLWAADWLETLLDLQGLSVEPRHRTALTKALELIASSDHRSMTDFIASLQDVDIREALAYYALGGPAGALLDSADDGLGTSDFQIFEMEHLMALGPKIVVPVLLYLFHHIERRLDGRPSLIVLDEAWSFLANSLFESKIREWLKTMRKKNTAVVFATQSPTDILNSRFANAIVESCPTKILLPNPQAQSPAVSPAYEALGLTSAQIARIAQAQPKREYYYVSPLGRRLFDLELDSVALAFLGVGSQDDIRFARSIQEQHGDRWPAVWLESKGLTDAAYRWLGYNA
jgi:type IV secretion/conjugal transfer VirB4 family ATPase